MIINLDKGCTCTVKRVFVSNSRSDYIKHVDNLDFCMHEVQDSK